MRVLYLIHGHENFSVGGAENAAFSLFRELQRHEGIETWILAAVHTSKDVLAHGELRSVEGTDREYLIGTSCEWFRFTNAHIPSLRRSLQRLLGHIEPDVIHLQHYVHFGIDIIPLLQSLCPAAKIVVTLHEYLALCRHNGQMVTTHQLKLCKKATPLACSMCYPEHSTGDFFLRHHYIKTILESCDALISPSHFLIQRYRDSGIDHPNFLMIENGLPNHFDLSRRKEIMATHSDALNRFGYFGQLNLYKGCLVLLKAVYLLQEQGITNFSVNIYGANLEHQPEEFQEEFKLFHDKVRDRVLLRGSYRQTELETLMQENDWVVVPSIWWENSPVVIQEALFHGRPVIGSELGGIAEKADSNGGITFTARSESALARVMEKAVANTSLHQALRRQIPEPTTAPNCAKQHVQAYESFLSRSEENTDWASNTIP
ncbi:glycosyltransferase [Synechococcus sp. CS-1332]|uniref:glycosyltransferase n=1 Tax=Synechococcus sp. CS-1332 TaxID=2847972 RepID=UPI00223AEEC0|nr:glycosyltransferase [Synechococcus sp. CS-1332]MCT0206133.1 glycosyltransferase [Synechococcus sp. CS-1332]